MSIAASPGTAPEIPGQVGRYRIDGVIARGAFGVVYRAHEEGSREILALKTLCLVDELELEPLRREAQLLERLRHPGIVSIRDSGVDRGVPWYAMELLEGGTLADVFAEKPPIRRSLGLLARLCEPLAYLHGEGIVHRDLKPSNVVVRDDDLPVIVDFGLIAHFAGASGREALHADGGISGTVAYMSPEQVAGELVDARSDLYSLGCILYEAVTGSPPFSGEPRRVLEHHANSVPRRPSELAPDLPPALDDLILKLLAKNPRHRPGYAEDVGEVLNEWSGLPARPRGSQPRRYLYRPSLVGREALTKEIVAALGRAASGHGAFLVVSGESGVGKTRLALEAARIAASARFDVVTAQCSILDVRSRVAADGPLAPLRPLLRAVADRCVTGGRATADRVLGRRARVLAAYEPALTQVPGFLDHPDTPSLPPDADRERTLADLTETVASYMQGSPLLLVVDDLQWADELTLAALATWCDGLITRLPLVILGVYRTEETHPGLDRVIASPSVQHLEVVRLSPDGVSRVVSDMLSMDEPPWDFVRWLARESEGNPFFVGEFLRGAVEAELLRRSPLAGWHVDTDDVRRDLVRGGLPISSRLWNVVARRLDALDDASRSIVEAGSVLGREFPLPLAYLLAEVPQSQQIDALGRLLRRQVLESAPGGNVRFAHDKLREVAYARIPEARRAALHRLAAESLEAAGDDARAQSAAALAHHWRGAGDKRRAIEYFGIAGSRALQAGAHGDAHLHLGSAIELDDETGRPSGSSRRSHWHRMRAIASFGIGDLDASIRHGNDALLGVGERVPRTTWGWAGVAAIEMLRRFVGPASAAASVADGAHAEVGDAHPVVVAALASAQLATSHFYRTNIVPTVANLLCGLNRSEQAGIDSLVVESSGRLAYVAGASGLHAIANRYFDRADAIGRRGGTPRQHAMSLYLRAQYAMGQAEWGRARQLAQEAIGVLDEIGDRSEAEIARAIAAHCEFYSSRFEVADTLLGEILESARDRAHQQHVAWAHFLLGRTQLALGRSAEAAARLREGRAVLIRVHDLLSLSMCEGLLSLALWRTGDTEGAEDVARCLLARMQRGRAAVPHAMDGYAGLLEALFEAASTGSSAAAADLRRVRRYLRAHTRAFPMSRPLLYRAGGWIQWVDGRSAQALRSWRSAADAAVALGMPDERARCLDQLARFSPEGDEAARSRALAAAIRAELTGPRRAPVRDT